MPDTTDIQAVVELYVASAQAITQLSTGALVATVVFSEKVLGTTGPLRVTRTLFASWMLFLSAIGCGVLYEYLAIHYLALKLELPLERSWFPNYLEHNPGFVYGMMMASFFLAATLFVLVAAGRVTASVKKGATVEA